jgi:hypothetical protein
MGDMMRRVLAFLLAATAAAWPSAAFALSASSIPTRVPTTWGTAAPGGNITCPIPIPSQTGITPGRASWTDGFPPLTFLAAASGGIPPFGQDFNGAFCQLSQWTRWGNAGAPVFYDATFSSIIGGYPQGAVLSAIASTGVGCFWTSAVDNNTTNPDTGGANWSSSCPAGGVGSTVSGSGNAQAITSTPFVRGTNSRLCWNVGAGFTNTGPLQINVNGTGLVNVLQRTLSGLAALVGGEVQAGSIACSHYDGTQYELDVSAAAASLVNQDQALSGGANVTVLAQPAGSIVVDAGARPLQYIPNSAPFTITAPTRDGSFMLQIENAGGGGGAVTFSGFTTNGNTGEALTTAASAKFVVTIWRIHGVSSYIVKALQ